MHQEHQSALVVGGVVIPDCCVPTSCILVERVAAWPVVGYPLRRRFHRVHRKTGRQRNWKGYKASPSIQVLRMVDPTM